ncbi:MAG: hypothetical protein H6929_06200 [Rhodoferax sp.]|nr:hypothetical protein [Rhodoferax sp.]
MLQKHASDSSRIDRRVTAVMGKGVATTVTRFESDAESACAGQRWLA